MITTRHYHHGECLKRGWILFQNAISNMALEEIDGLIPDIGVVQALARLEIGGSGCCV